MTKTIRIKKPADPFHRDIQHLIYRRRSRAIEREVVDAYEILRRFQEKAGNKPDRTPSQTETLSSIPPITAFMGMGG
jgi:hypothetical protein